MRLARLLPLLVASATPAFALGSEALDVVFVVDTSESTCAASGADLDGDGETGKPKGQPFWFREAGRVQPSSDEGDDLLAAELSLVRALLARLDPATTRAGLVVFAGDGDALTPDAHTEVPLTSDYAKLERGLRAVRRRGSKGGTNMLSAVSTATIELIGSQSAYSKKREGAARRVVFLSDGHPTLPLENKLLQNAQMTVQQAVRASKASIRIDTFALGEAASADPVTLKEMARVTGGTFTAVPDATQISRIAGQVRL